MGVRRDPAFILFGEGIEHYSWRGVRLFFAVYFGAFLFAALAAPLFYMWIMGMETPADPDSVVAYLQSKHLDRYIDRARLLGTLVLLVWLIGRSSLWGRFGFSWARGGLRVLGRFFLFGLVSLGIVVVCQFLLLDPRMNPSAGFSRIAKVVFSALAGGLLIGWLEESIFRGMLFRMFYSATKPMLAVVLSAFVFAMVHFKDVPDTLGEPLSWYSGFLVAGYQSVSFIFTAPWLEFANLMLVGVILVLIFMRTHNLVACMGMHAGWVFVRNIWSELYQIPTGPDTLFWGTDRIVDGYACLIILAVLVIVLYADLRAHMRKGQVSLGNLA